MNVLMRKLNGLVRYGMVHALSGALPLWTVNEYPKSGGTWLGQMLAAALDVPFPRNRFPVLRPSLMHGHYLRPWGMRNVVVLWRDGRDVAVSWYFHCLFPNDRGNAALVAAMRRAVPFRDYDNVRENLPAFIDACATRPRYPSFSWSDFVRQWHGRPGVVYARYEDLHRDAAAELRRIVFELTGQPLAPAAARAVADSLSFARQTGRQPGDEHRGSFLRKGVVGDWRNHFSDEARRVFDAHAGEALVMLGYEKDRTWVARESA